MTEESKITFGSWFRDIKENTLTFQDGVTINVQPPKNYDNNLPEIPDLTDHEKMSLVKIDEYFTDLFDNRNIVIINQIPLLDEYEYIIQCDYCNITVAMKMRHCDRCDKNMCNLCYSEKTEEIAVQNGAKNWQRRKDSLLTCFEHDCFSLRGMDTHNFNCDVCTCTSGEKNGTWSCNRLYDVDLCYNCTMTVEGRQLTQKYKDGWKKFQMGLYRYNGWGSMFDWVPIMYHTDTFDRIYYNINKDCKNYHRVALSSTDEHGQTGIFIISDTLTQVMEKLTEYMENDEDITPIKLYLSRLDHPIHYG